ncbi:4-hydroxythreonine-4-phosphate dehydrogenase 1 [Roseovarius sp. A-2]|uniref:4-hydroxythreonine-4-phosphate dehydrogenase PdxA n=1 Tax=Roseovarius sp. A-2 TaxID=1570360 RepID=UPI0009B59917|nr:4-hydroxythreonine-4-phosphate dehydrogenase PdxA [Roseovarius sp. A-2]GAW35685.1 4-hydroxythreonine-4-phosphate dehydrogenase 1 [Roseovarius sp. A-2]
MSVPVALTCGEPSGIGPEIAAAAWDALRGHLPFFLIGDPAHLPEGTPHVVIEHPAEAMAACAQALPVLRHDFAGVRIAGTPQPAQAQGVIDVIARGVGLVQAGEALALCTAPIHKQALQEGAGFAFPGHTEYLAHLAGVGRVVMMLASDALRVVPATIHIPLKDVSQALTGDLLEQTVRITHAALIRDFGISAPRLAVAGLNPHAGEGGRMGTEEIEVIAPVLERLRGEGLDLRGPLSADTMFHGAARAGYDAAICMYHDQALIPIKTLDFDRGVNVTLGLPFIRTSPDHGTALDIAGQGVANPTSLIEALRMAQAMGRARRG